MLDAGYKLCRLCGLAFPIRHSDDISNRWTCQRLCGRLYLVDRQLQLETWVHYMAVCNMIRNPEIEPVPDWWQYMKITI